MNGRPTSASIVIATFNGADWLPQQLDALALQTDQADWEVVIADNGSSDSTRVVAETYRSKFNELTVIDASDHQGKQWAQGCGVAASSGDALLFLDQDDVVRPGWLTAMLDALADHDFVGGNMEVSSLNDARSIAARPYSRTGVGALPEALGAGPYAVGGNLGVWRHVFADGEPLPALPPSASAGEDRDLAFRLRRRGYTLGFAEDAVVSYRLRENGKQLRKQMRWYGVADAALVKRHRALGAHGDSVPHALRKWLFLLPRAIKACCEGNEDHWARAELAAAWGRIVGSLRFRVVCL